MTKTGKSRENETEMQKSSIIKLLGIFQWLENSPRVFLVKQLVSPIRLIFE